MKVIGNPISVGEAPAGIAFDSKNNRMYVVNNNTGAGADTVSVIDTTTNDVTVHITVGDGPYGIAFDSANNRMYVGNYIDSTVSVIDTLDEEDEETQEAPIDTLDEEDEEDSINILEEAAIVAATTTTITADHLKTKNLTNNIEVKIYGGIMGFCFGKAYTKLTSKSANIKRIVLE